MGSKGRKDAIKAEVARRELLSGVPADRHLYKLTMHHADEGGPRTFFPTRCRENLNRTQGEYEPDLLQRLIELAIATGEPIEVEPSDAECFIRNAPLADCCEVGNLMMFSTRAADALGEMLRTSCHLVPLACKTQSVVGFVCNAVEDVLDRERAVISWTKTLTEKIATGVDTYAFHTDRLGRSAVFRIPEDRYSTLVLQPFVDKFLANGLNGFRFKKVWPHTTLDVWADEARIIRWTNRDDW